MEGDAVKILVIDDEFGIREGCRKILEDEGYYVETAEDGKAGLDAFNAGKDFAVVLVDLKMPRMGGIELIEHVRKIDKKVVILVITAYATIETAVEATKRGAYGYIPKPFTPDELLLPVKNGIERRALAIEAERLREEREKRLLEVTFERTKSKTIINCMTDPVLVINCDRHVVLRNAAAMRVVPRCAETEMPFPIERLGYNGLCTLVSEVLKERENMLIVSREIKLGESTYMANVSPVAEPNSETLGAVAILRDITALKKLELAKSMFVSMVAHELKNPLATIEGYLNVVLSGAAGYNPERDKQMLQRSVLKAKTLRTLISELMNLTAIETGNFTIKRIPSDIRDIVSEAFEQFGERAKEKNIVLTKDFSKLGKEVQVMADKDAMRSVFANLIDNALKYTMDDGKVSVTLEDDGPYIRMCVTDSGIGMTKEECSSIFNEFYRARNRHTANIPGTGLGLVLVKRLVDMHQGKICVESTPDNGSRFAVSIPKTGQIRGEV